MQSCLLTNARARLMSRPAEWNNIPELSPKRTCWSVISSPSEFERWSFREQQLKMKNQYDETSCSVPMRTNRQEAEGWNLRDFIDCVTWGPFKECKDPRSEGNATLTQVFQCTHANLHRLVVCCLVSNHSTAYGRNGFKFLTCVNCANHNGCLVCWWRRTRHRTHSSWRMQPLQFQQPSRKMISPESMKVVIYGFRQCKKTRFCLCQLQSVFMRL